MPCYLTTESLLWVLSRGIAFANVAITQIKNKFKLVCVIYIKGVSKVNAQLEN